MHKSSASFLFSFTGTIEKLLCMLVISMLVLQGNAQTEGEMLSAELGTRISEGIKLYRSEQASRYAADIFSEQYPEKSDAMGGYLSYPDENGMKSIFFSGSMNLLVIATVSFDSTLNPLTAQLSKKERSLTKLEMAYYILQLRALTDINTQTDFFKTYKNTSFNLVPVIDSNERKVYILTGLKQSCVVIFGNDYLLGFDENSKIESRKQIHRNLIAVSCMRNQREGDAKAPGAMHLHTAESDELITATDICTLMLYEKQANWKQHTVFSKTKVCIWNCENNTLQVMTKSDWSNLFNRASISSK